MNIQTFDGLIFISFVMSCFHLSKTKLMNVRLGVKLQLHALNFSHCCDQFRESEHTVDYNCFSNESISRLKQNTLIMNVYKTHRSTSNMNLLR